jgi:predicted nucleotidyltransferase
MLDIELQTQIFYLRKKPKFLFSSSAGAMLQLAQTYPEFNLLRQNYFALRKLDQLLILWSGQARQKLKRKGHEFIADFLPQITQGLYEQKSGQKLNFFDLTLNLMRQNCALLKKIDPWAKSF